MKDPSPPLDKATVPLVTGSTRRVVGASIAVTSGPDAGKRHQLLEPSLTIGKGPLAGFRLTDQAVSREHLRLQLGPSSIAVRDGGSKNGTWMGGARVHHVELTSDAVLTLGATTLTVTVDLTATEDILVSEREQFGAAYAESLPMRHLFAVLLRASRSDISILLEGESGVGKELLARAIHEHSPRSDGPFIPIDCGAIPPNLIESELFGHEKGAFTGAGQARAGLFEQANGGTVFLDELGELPIELQPKLLRVLEQREVRALGGKTTTPIDIRVVSATNQNLIDRCAEGAFREDLFYRVATSRFRVPALRERPDDIAPLARRLLRDLTRDPGADMPADILAMLGAYSWPGNVRELRNVVSRFALLDARDRRELFDGAPPAPPPSKPALAEDLSGMPFHEARQVTLERLEAAYFPAALARAGGMITRAAAMSGISRSSFYRMLERHAGLKGETPPEEP